MKNKSYEHNIFNVGKNFHGHLGPFLVLGLKAGKLLLEKIGKNPLTSVIVAELPQKRPFSCFIDGIQVTVGCTLGKLNIFLHSDKGIKIYYKCNNKIAILVVKENILKEVLHSVKSKEEMVKESEKIWSSDSSRLFDLRIV